MAATITFSLRNNQMHDVNVNVVDLRNNTQVLSNYPLNQDESVTIQIVSGSDGKGGAAWTFWSSDGSVNSNKQEPNISDGDECTLG